MLIKSADLDAIWAGRIDTLFRRWTRPTVKAGGTLVTARGVLSIEAVEIVTLEAVPDDDLRRDPVQRRVGRVERTRQGRVVRVEPCLSQGGDQLGHHSSRDRSRIPAASSSVTSRGAVDSSRCCFIAPSTRSGTSALW